MENTEKNRIAWYIKLLIVTLIFGFILVATGIIGSLITGNDNSNIPDDGLLPNENMNDFDGAESFNDGEVVNEDERFMNEDSSNSENSEEIIAEFDDGTVFDEEATEIIPIPEVPEG